MFSSVKFLYRNRSSNVCADTLAEDYPICVLMVCFFNVCFSLFSQQQKTPMVCHCHFL